MRKGLRIRSTYAKAIWSGEPWVFSKAIIDSTFNLDPGDYIDLRSRDGKVIGQGFFNPFSEIMVRVVRWWDEDAPFDVEELIEWRIRQALQLRHRLGLPNISTNVYRLLNSEGDRLSGLIIDIFDKVAVVQYSAYWVSVYAMHIRRVLFDLLDIEAVVFRPSKTAMEREQLPKIKSELSDDVDETIITEHGIKYKIDPREGQKTGFYIDQRDNRLMLRAFANGAKCLDVCSFTGGFSINMAAGGAESIISVDTSDAVLELLKYNAELNGFSDRIQTIRGDAQGVMDSLHEQFDIVVLDPPKLAKRPESFFSAKMKYEHWNAAAIRRVKPGGLLFTCSCSSIMKRDAFLNMLKEAAHRAQRHLKILKITHAAPDHPIDPSFLRSEYLKCVLLEVE